MATLSVTSTPERDAPPGDLGSVVAGGDAGAGSGAATSADGTSSPVGTGSGGLGAGAVAGPGIGGLTCDASASDGGGDGLSTTLPGEPATGAERGASTGAGRGFSTGGRGASTDADRGFSTDADRGFSTGRADRGFSTGAAGRGFSTGSVLRSTDTARSGPDDEGTARGDPRSFYRLPLHRRRGDRFRGHFTGSRCGGIARQPSHTPPTMSGTRIPINQERAFPAPRRVSGSRNATGLE